MKTDIIEGRLLVTPEKAVLLASYGLQVELGDHDDNVHTVQSLQNFTLLPKHMTRSAEILEDFVRQVVLAYKSLRGLPPAEAELLYIAETRQCEGYGEEYFQARDEDGNEAFVGYCLEGIIVKRLQGVPIKYRWEEITRASWHKRTLSVNFREVSSIAFTMEDCETCKYATAIFNLQLEFFKDVSWRNQTGHRNGYYEMRSSFASVQKGNNRSNEAVVKKITLFNDSGASAIGNVNLNNGACEKIVNQQGFICDYLDLEQTENGQQGTDLSCFKTGVTNQNGKLPTCSSWSEYDSALDNLRQLSYSTPHILPSSICGINVSQTRLDVTLENLTELSEVGVTPTSGTSFRPSTKVFDDVDEVFTQAPAHASCSSSSTVSSSRRSSVQPQVTLGKQLPEFEDKGMENKKDSTALSVATSTVYNGGLCVVRPDLIQGNEVSDISNDERLADMCCRLKEGFLTEEFDKIPRKRVSAGVSTSQKAENQKRNRYANILPYEDTRIMLRPNKTNTSGYVNASNIQEGGIEKSCQYWPMEGDGKTKLKFGDFQVSLQSSTVSKTQVTCCLQLKHTPSSSRRVVYHLQYLDWPTGEVPASVDSFLAFLDEVSSVKRHLENEQQKNLENVYSRSRSQSRSSLFDISNQSTGSWKRSIPGPSCSLGFLPARDRERSLSDATSSPLSVALSGSLSGATMGSLESPPVVVHCCSGAGRTGVYILTELMVYCLEHNHNMDISKMLALLRQQRMHLVQTMAQYKFVYTCLVDYLRNSRLI